MNKKRLLALCLGTAVAFSAISGCGGTEDGTQTPSNETDPKEEDNHSSVMLSGIPYSSHGWRNA